MTRMVVQLRCSEGQKLAWERAAGEAGLSAWARGVLDEAAGGGVVRVDMRRSFPLGSVTGDLARREVVPVPRGGK